MRLLKWNRGRFVQLMSHRYRSVYTIQIHPDTGVVLAVVYSGWNIGRNNYGFCVYLELLYSCSDSRNLLFSWHREFTLIWGDRARRIWGFGDPHSPLLISLMILTAFSFYGFCLRSIFPSYTPLPPSLPHIYNHKNFNFPASIVVMIPGFHCLGPGSIPGWGTEIPHATQHCQKIYIYIYF